MTLFKDAFAPSKLATSNVIYQRCCLLMSAMQEYSLWRFGHRHNISWPLLWATTTLIFTLYHGIKNRHSAHREPSYVSRSTITRTARNALFFGSLWAMLPLLFFSNAHQASKLLSLVFAPVYWVAVRLYWPVSQPPR